MIVIKQDQLVYLISEKKLKPRPKYRVTRIFRADQTEASPQLENGADISQDSMCDLEAVNIGQKLPRPNPYRMIELERLPQSDERKPEDFLDDITDAFFEIDLD